MDALFCFLECYVNSWDNKMKKENGTMRKNLRIRLVVLLLIIGTFGMEVFAADNTPNKIKGKDGIGNALNALESTYEKEYSYQNGLYQSSELISLSHQIHVNEMNNVIALLTQDKKYSRSIDHRSIKLLEEYYSLFGPYVEDLLEAGFIDVDFTASIDNSLKNGEITHAEADRLKALNKAYLTGDAAGVAQYSIGTVSADAAITEMNKVMYTIEGADLYATDGITTQVSGLQGGLPVQVSGIVGDGAFVLVNIAGNVYYIKAAELVEQ